LYRARKKNVTCYNQMIVAIVGTLTVIIVNITIKVVSTSTIATII
jgi:hypothetical protein